MIKKYFITVSLITIILSCNQASKEANTSSNDGRNQTHSLQDMPTNHINAWSDRCGFSFELHHDSIWAFGDEFIKYERINDSLFNIIYPKKTMIIKDVRLSLIHI